MKIGRIEISDFRAFPGPATYTFDLGGKNLLVYGENGSGKSSLFNALSEFFNLDLKPKSFPDFKNIFSDPSLADGHITIYFEDGTFGIWSFAGPRPLADTQLAERARRFRGIDYRALLKTHFVHTGNKVNLFSVAVTSLLAQYGVPTPGGRSTTIGKLWQRVLESKPRNHRGHNVLWASNAVDDFNAAFAPLLPSLGKKVQELLAEFQGCQFDLEFEFPKVQYDKELRKYVGNELNLIVRYNGKLIEGHQHFLNEARLSALALALYFAGLLASIPAPPPGRPDSPKMLVLDDAVIGLDMSNRLPVLDILKNYFPDWQILLLTYDRAWYEIAKQRLPSTSWGRYELFTQRVGNHEQPILLPDDDHIYRALDFLDKGQVKAAGAHMRTAFELVLKHACEEFRIPVKYQAEPRKVPASDLWSALKSHKCEIAAVPKCAFDRKGQAHWWHPAPAHVPIVPQQLVTRIQHAVSWVLNPLNHSQPVDHYRAEIEDAIYAVDELQTAVNRAMSLRSTRPTMPIEMLVALLKAWVMKSEQSVTIRNVLTREQPT